MARIEPNRKWFGNTRLIGQDELDRFRQAVSTAKKDPYQVILSQAKLPMSLIKEPATDSESRFHILETQPFQGKQRELGCLCEVVVFDIGVTMVYRPA